jgi:membrane associated rhomboid family serine protease
MSQRGVLVLAGVVLLAGIVLGLADLGVAANAAAIVLGGIGGVLLVAVAFYAVGRSEDRDRERDRES